MQELKKRLAERKKKTDASGLKEADPLIAKFEKAVESLEKTDVDRKKALVKLNNLSKEISEERENLGSSEKTREQLKQLKDIQSGPADRIASALQNGNMQRAMDELRKLSETLRSDELSAAEKEQLKNQLQQLGKEIEKMLGGASGTGQTNSERRAEKIDELKKKGDLAGAGALQRKLDQLQQQMDCAGESKSAVAAIGGTRQSADRYCPKHCRMAMASRRPNNWTNWRRRTCNNCRRRWKTSRRSTK